MDSSLRVENMSLAYWNLNCTLGLSLGGALILQSLHLEPPGMSAVTANRLDRPWSQNHPISPTPPSFLQVLSFTVSNCIGLLFAIHSHTSFSGFVHVQSFDQKPFPAFQASFVLRKRVDRQTTSRNKQSDWQAHVFPMFYVFFPLHSSNLRDRSCCVLAAAEIIWGNFATSSALWKVSSPRSCLLSTPLHLPLIRHSMQCNPEGLVYTGCSWRGSLTGWMQCRGLYRSLGLVEA